MTLATRLAWDGGLGISTDSSGGDFLPDVVAPPATLPAARIVAESIDSVTIDGTDFKPVGNSAEQPYARHRIIVGGKDVTYFRDVQTPFPTYSLVSPLRYGAGYLTFPQIHAAFEIPGEGALSWLKPLAQVKVQRVDADGNLVDGGDRDFIGYIADFQYQGRNFSCTLGGRGTANSQWQYRPPPIFPRVTDAGAQIMQMIQHELRLPVAGEPDTGIELLESGGGSQFDFLTNLLAKSVERDGTQWTVMPNADGKFEMTQKDTSTIDATLYVDGYHVEQNLRRDFSEESNRVFIQGVDRDGKRIRFAIWPGMLTTKWVFAGTTLNPGDSGDEVVKVIFRLAATGWLSGSALGLEWTTDAHDPVTLAIKDLQDDAGLTVNGSVNAATWKALMRGDNKSLRRAKIKPAAQKSYTKAFLTDATGNILAKNPKYIRSSLFIDRILSDAIGFDRSQDIAWARADLVDETSPNLVGTVTVNTGAVIDGAHNPGDPLTADLVRDGRSILPGMNLWLANFGGTSESPGTLVHVSGVNVRQSAPGALSVEYTVDTRARDTMPVWEIIRRNRESRRLANRNPIELNRRSNMLDDQGTYDGQMFGRIERTFIPEGEWVKIATAAGRMGILNRIDFVTDEPAAFVFTIMGKEPPDGWADRKLGDPFADDFPHRVKQNLEAWQDNRGLIDVWGNNKQPCGYWPLEHTDEDGVTDAPITGKFRDKSGALYGCIGSPSLWILVRADRDTWIRGAGEQGRALELLLNDGSF